MCINPEVLPYDGMKMGGRSRTLASTVPLKDGSKLQRKSYASVE